MIGHHHNFSQVKTRVIPEKIAESHPHKGPAVRKPYRRDKRLRSGIISYSHAAFHHRQALLFFSCPALPGLVCHAIMARDRNRKPRFLARIEPYPRDARSQRQRAPLGSGIIRIFHAGIENPAKVRKKSPALVQCDHISRNRPIVMVPAASGHPRSHRAPICSLSSLIENSGWAAYFSVIIIHARI